MLSTTFLLCTMAAEPRQCPGGVCPAPTGQSVPAWYGSGEGVTSAAGGDTAQARQPRRERPVIRLLGRLVLRFFLR